jgi:hypothetical protein
MKVHKSHHKENTFHLLRKIGYIPRSRESSSSQKSSILALSSTMTGPLKLVTLRARFGTPGFAFTASMKGLFNTRKKESQPPQSAGRASLSTLQRRT